MIKIVAAKNFSQIEKFSIEEGASEEKFMENAGMHVAERVQEIIALHHLKPSITLLIGKGNNGGDAFVAGRYLIKNHRALVDAIALFPQEECSQLCRLQWDRFKREGGEIFLASNYSLDKAEILVDGIFGTGFQGKTEGLVEEIITKANNSGKMILSIDIPSGINGTTGDILGTTIKAHETVFLGLPKSGCFLGSAWEYTGRVSVKNFGLAEKYLDQVEPDGFLIEKKDLSPLLPKIERTRHKYQAGYVLGIGGSSGMEGAGSLASWAALRSGCGIVRLFHQKDATFPSFPLEIIHAAYSEDYREILQEIPRASSCFIGPGMGLSQQSLLLLERVLATIDKPLVIDADALTLIAEHKLLMPKNAILTPHKGELKRLLGLVELPKGKDLWHKCRTYAAEKEITLILKGSPTYIFHKNDLPLISIFGDPGMATAGTGDVLTGILASFLAQGKNPKEAAILGVGIHGLSGEMAAQQLTSYSLIASDLINFLNKIIAELIIFSLK